MAEFLGDFWWGDMGNMMGKWMGKRENLGDFHEKN